MKSRVGLMSCGRERKTKVRKVDSKVGKKVGTGSKETEWRCEKMERWVWTTFSDKERSIITKPVGSGGE